MKEMERVMAAELLELSLRVMNETDHYISMSVNNYGSFISVYVMENGFQKGGDFDGAFYISPITEGIGGNYGDEEFEKAKKYLNKLLREKKKGAA